MALIRECWHKSTKHDCSCAKAGLDLGQRQGCAAGLQKGQGLDFSAAGAAAVGHSFDEMRHGELMPDLSAWTLVIACMASGHWQTAFAVLDDMSQALVQPSVVCYNAVLSALSRGTQGEAALSKWRSWEAQGVRPSCVTYTCLMGCCHWTMALQLLGQMPQQRMETDLVAWNAALNACGDARSWHHAVQLLQLMEDSQVSPDIISFSSCLAACANSAWERSIELFARAQRRFRVDAQICVAALTACATGACWQHALEVLRLRPNLPQTRSGLGALVAALVPCWSRAMQLLLEDRGMADLVTWNTLLAATPWEIGLALLSLMSKTLRADCASYGALLRSCENVHEWEAAIALLKDMTERQVPPDLVACCSTLSACEKGRQWQRCLILLTEMWRSSSHVSHVSPDIVAYGAAVSACEKCGQWPAALSLLEQLWERKLQLDQVAGNAVLSALGSGQQWRMALSLFFQMAQAEMVDLISYNAVMDQCPWDMALGLAQEMSHQQLQPDLITTAALSRRLELGGAVAAAALKRCCGLLELQGMAVLELHRTR
eukprot:s1453_g1.t1